MWLATAIVMLCHLFLVGIMCLIGSELGFDSEVIYTIFSAYFFVLTAITTDNHYKLISNLMYNREETLKVLDESLGEK